eukprot:7296077-Lingulodinium_polyedra.AAC.1
MFGILFEGSDVSVEGGETGQRFEMPSARQASWSETGETNPYGEIPKIGTHCRVGFLLAQF